MTTVYVCVEYGWDTADVVGVYATKELAIRAIIAVRNTTITMPDDTQAPSRRNLEIEAHEVRTDTEVPL
jgi:hypothetical protein